MFKSKSIEGVIEKLSKEKCLNNISVYDEYLDGKSYCFNTVKGNNWVLEPEAVNKCKIRIDIANTLRDTNFKRKNQKWTQYMVVAFITEVLENYNGGINANDIAERYNVPVNKLESTVSMFFSLHQNRYCLRNFFTDYDFTLWRFREIKTFDKLKKQGKITNDEIKLLLRCNMIEFNYELNEYVAINSLLDILER